MGTTIEDVLKDIDALLEHVDYYLLCKGREENKLSFHQTLNELKERLRQIEAGKK